MLAQQVMRIVTQLSDDQLEQVYDYVMIMQMSNTRPERSAERTGILRKERLLQFQGLWASTFADTSTHVDELIYGNEPAIY